METYGLKICNFQNCGRKHACKGDMCDLHQKICIFEGCEKRKLGSGKFCRQHTPSHLIQVVTIKRGKCIVDGCNNKGKRKGKKCTSHSEKRKCAINDCDNQTRAGKCAKHSGYRRCPNCINWIDSRYGQYKYDYYCATCFKHLFPDDPRSLVIYNTSKETQVRNFINQHFDGFIHNIPIYTGNCNCTHRRRIDHRKLINETILAIETDEFAHSGYNKKDEEIRYDDLYMIHSGKWIFIRFNPDKKGIDLEDKLETLRICMIEQIERIENNKNIDLVEIIKLFY
jgi:hypothetical protein